MDEKKIKQIISNNIDLTKEVIPNSKLWSSENTLRVFTERCIKIAIEQFLKDLWHDASKEPRKEATILIETKRKFYYVWKEWQNNFYPFWDDAVACSNITRWLYIDDLLEQKGGE